MATRHDAFDERALIKAALAVRSKAHAPYSRFHVGAALLDVQQRVHVGCNVENASYGLTICAERVAVVAAVASGSRSFVALAVATSGGHAPCGACRQFLSEFCDDLCIVLVDAERPDSSAKISLEELLPARFRLRQHPS